MKSDSSHREDVLERLKAFKKHTGMSLNKFVKRIGMEYVTVHNQFRQERALSLDTVVNTLCAFEELSPDWLILGKGNMLRKNSPMGSLVSAISILQKTLVVANTSLENVKTELSKQERL